MMCKFDCRQDIDTCGCSKLFAFPIVQYPVAGEAKQIYLFKHKVTLFVILHTFHNLILIVYKVRTSEIKNKIALDTYSFFN